MHSGDREGHRRYTLPRCPAFYAGAFYTCDVAADTKAYCWGDNGTLGVGGIWRYQHEAKRSLDPEPLDRRAVDHRLPKPAHLTKSELSCNNRYSV